MLFHAQSVTCLMATLVFSMNNCAHDTMIASNPCLDLNVLLVLYRRALQSSVLPRLAMTRALGDHMLKMPAGDLDQSNKGVLTVLTWYETLTTDVLPDAAQWCGQQRAGHHLHGCHEAGLMMRCAKLPRLGIWPQKNPTNYTSIVCLYYCIYKFLKCTVPHSVYVLQYVCYIVSFLLPLHYLASPAADLWFSSSQTDS